MSPESSSQPSGASRPSNFDLLFSIKYFDPKLLRHEPHLNTTRFPEYSGSVASLNWQFANAYREAFKDHFRSHVNMKGASTTRGIDIHIFNTAMDVSDKGGDRFHIHRLRQVADLGGLPYYTFIKFCMDFVSGRNAKYIARPNQLIAHTRSNKFFDETLVEFISTTGTRLTKSFHLRFPELSGKKKPACVGDVGSRDESSPVCVECKFFKICGRMCETVAADARKIEIDTKISYSKADRLKHIATVRRQKNRLLLKAKRNLLKNDAHSTI